jgi:2-succinyl-5-enolpyruvyl-6-hydroxy-3-cyclohexene-1-carboxylate synthase
LQQSVPSPSAVQATFAATLFDEWVRRGLRDVVVCPGSRSTPLVLACARRIELAIHVRIDERSAGFFAIGRALATNRPVAVVVTSGTAAAELHACVAEADLAFVPLLILTADRPLELHGVGAPQTMDQDDLYGTMVRRFEDPGVAQLDDASNWRDLARRLWRSAIDTVGGPGPVHLNAAFAEPLIGEALALSEPIDVPDEVGVTLRTDIDVAGRRVLCVVGRGVARSVIDDCVSMEWVVLGDATASGATAYFDPLLRVASFAALAKPDVVVRLGGLPASRVLQERLRQWRVRTIGFDGAGFIADPDRLVAEVVSGLPSRDELRKGDVGYGNLWRSASRQVGQWLETLDSGPDLSEPLVARAVVEASTRHDVPLVVGSSMPVRDVEWWGPPRTAPPFANRGVNGIDGVVSTALGVGAGAASIGLIGDVTMLHDVSGLVDGLGHDRGSCVLVVIDNSGGGIFSFLPQAAALGVEEFEELFATPRHHDLVGIARAFGHSSELIDGRQDLERAIDAGLSRPGVTVVVVRVPTRSQNVAIHDSMNAVVQRLLEDGE